MKELQQQVHDFAAAKQLLSKQETAVRARLMMWWNDVLARRGEDVLELLLSNPDGFDQRAYTADWYPSAVVLADTQKFGDQVWRCYHLHYSNMGVAIECSLSCVSGRPASAKDLWCRNIIIFTEQELSDDDLAIKNAVAQFRQKEDALKEASKSYDQVIQKWFTAYLDKDKNLEMVVRRMNVVAGLAPALSKDEPNYKHLRLWLERQIDNGDRIFCLHFGELDLVVKIRSMQRHKNAKVIVPADIDPVVAWAPYQPGK